MTRVSIRSFAGLFLALLGVAAVFCLCINAQPLPKTRQAELYDLSERFAERLQAGRTVVYHDLLRSEALPQRILNEHPDIQLMYMNERGHPVFYILHNINAARTLSTDDVWPGGSGGFSLSGSGTVLGELGIWDGGDVRTSHQEFGGRVTQMDALVGTHFHATHVAGTMVGAGVNPDAKGMSYEATLAAYDWDSDNAEMAAAAALGMNVSNHSYGYAAGWEYYYGYWYWFGDTTISTTEDYGFGFYDSSAQDWDQIAYSAPYYTIVNSAGNDRNDFGPAPGDSHYVRAGVVWVWSRGIRDVDGGSDMYDCIPYTATAKNIISVGAINDIPGGYTAPGDVVMSSFSGWGPTDDGRIKPDLVTNGISLLSCVDAGDNTYASYSGTSMAAPNLSGSLNLLVRHYEATHSAATPLSSTMKAILIKTADEAGSAPGPDYEYGWGLVNTLEAAELIETDGLTPGHIVEGVLSDGDTNIYVFCVDSTDTVRLALAWTDLPGTPPTPSLNPTTPMLVNDLDLRLERLIAGTVYYPYVLDPSNPDNAATTGDNTRDNVEVIQVNDAPRGCYMVKVSHKGTLSVSQAYSLVDSRVLEQYMAAVEMSAFTATGRPGHITIEWATGNEIDMAGFNVYRSLSNEGERVRLNAELIPSRGNELDGAGYSFRDVEVAPGVTYYYWLESVDLMGVTNKYGPVVAAEQEGPAPTVFRLAQNYPNPFNPTTEIVYDLPVDCRVSLEIYNALGRRVTTLIDEHQKAGTKTARWDGKDSSGAVVSSGVYFYKLQAGSFSKIRKMVLLK